MKLESVKARKYGTYELTLFLAFRLSQFIYKKERIDA